MSYSECDCGRMLTVGDAEKCHKCQSEDLVCNHLEQRELQSINAPFCMIENKRIFQLDSYSANNWPCDGCERRQ